MLRFGLSEVDITPALPVELAGYGYDLDRAAESIDSKLSGHVMAIEDGEGQRAALCAVDLVSVNKYTVERVQAAVDEHFHDDNTVIAINASHTHSGPGSCCLHGAGGYNPEYVEELLIPRLTGSILSAFRATHEGEIGIARTLSDGLSYNRTGESSVDKRVTALRVNSDRHFLAGAQFACHPVVYGSRSKVVSSDYPGIARTTLHNSLDSGMELWLTGSAGDIDPETNRQRKNQTTASDVADLGIAVGELAAGLIPDIATHTGKLRATSTVIRVPINTDFELLTPTEIAIFRENHQLKPSQEVGPFQTWIERVAPIVNDNTDTYIEVPLTLINIGKTVFAGFGAEIYNETGLDIEAQYPEFDVVTMMNTNAHEGYIPPRIAYEKSEYGARVSAFIFGRKPLTDDSEAVFRQSVTDAMSEFLK